MTIDRYRRVCAVVLMLVAAACSSPSTPDESPANAVSIEGVTPSSGSTINVVEGGQPGLALPRGSGLLRVTVNVATAPSLTDARLAIELLKAVGSDALCGANLPDQPTWPPEPRGGTTTYRIDGFQIYGVPCDVRAIRAVLFRRADLHNNMRPSPQETLAESTVAVSYQLR